MSANLPANCFAVSAPVTASVWQILVASGALVAAGDVVVIVESMKMEMAIISPEAGRVHEVGCLPGRVVQAGQDVVVIERI